ncbi:hypothetical protein LCGC14_2200720 [marine sediment metagenome]|uniref:Uncharacterized protein n=1 Tax=marine sediment metagenome TaxID=412755 RepID=A0A0F9FU53_9ZZZZ
MRSELDVGTEAATVDDLLQAVADEREEMADLKREIYGDIVRLVLTPIERVKAIKLVKLQKDLDRYNELKRKYF